MLTKKIKLYLLLLYVPFAIWCALFIYNSSFLIEGRRYFSLFDDAMISMKYAWNLANGNGLVWAAGERVEGYTNFLWTLIMSAVNVMFEKTSAVVAMQALGIPILMFIIYATAKLAALSEFTEQKHKQIHEILSTGMVAAYYPLLYWTLMGMETGLLTALITAAALCMFIFLKNHQIAWGYKMSALLSLAYLTRPDSLYMAALIYAATFYYLKKDWKKYFKILVPLVCTFIILQVFRFTYYGELIPNTATLKVVGHPLLARIENGMRFVQPFMLQSFLLIGLLLAAIIYNSKTYKLFFFLMFLGTCSYQVFVGGDPWPYWRMIVPSIPFAAVLASSELINVCQKLMQFSKFRTGAIWVFTLMATFVIIYFYNRPFYKEILFVEKPYQVEYNKNNVEYALNLKRLTTPQARVGVFWAGTIPYYSERNGVDFLGKSDKYIANLSPHILLDPKPATGPLFVPGHNKYDLKYTIHNLAPDVIERFDWANDTVYNDPEFNYEIVNYNGTNFIINKSSQNIRRDRL